MVSIISVVFIFNPNLSQAMAETDAEWKRGHWYSQVKTKSGTRVRFGPELNFVLVVPNLSQTMAETDAEWKRGALVFSG